MKHQEDPSPRDATESDGSERGLPGQGAGHGGLEDHHFEYPTVEPVPRPAPATTRQW